MNSFNFFPNNNIINKFSPPFFINSLNSEIEIIPSDNKIYNFT